MALSCFGKLCAKVASKQPKKRYNDYVPAVFPTETPDWRSPISAGTARNISTVQDYVGENIQRAPKVSRRLWRRIVADHANDVALGQVKVGVHCYIGLLSSMSEGDASLLAEEIIRKDDSVVPMLLSAKTDSAENRARFILGLELLTHFMRAQSSSDVSTLLAEHTQQACKMLQQGDCSERDSAALRVLREYVSYTRRLTVPCEHLSTIQSTAQDWLLRDSKETGVTSLDPGFVQSQQVHDLYTTTKTSRLAQALLQEVSLLCQDTTVGAQVVANGLQSISSHRAWDEGIRQQVTLRELRAGQQAGGTQLLLLSGLLDELRNPALQDGAAPVVLRAAAQEASSLPCSLAPSALAKVLTATAPLVPLEEQASSASASLASGAVDECVTGLARDCQEPELLLESIATTLSGADYSNPQQAIRTVKGVQAPTALYTELCRLATVPAQAAGEPPLALQASASRAATDALQLHAGVLKPAAVQALLQNVDHQLAPTARHSPAQLAAAADLHSAVVARAPPEAVVQSANAMVPRIGGAAAAPRGEAEAVEQDPSTGKLVATGAKQDEAAAQRAIEGMNQDGQAQKFCVAVEQALGRQAPPAATSSSSMAADATWAPNAAALADAAAIEDGAGCLFDSIDPLTDSGMEGQRRREMVPDYKNGTPRVATPAGTTPGGTTEDMDAYFMMPPSPAGSAAPLSTSNPGLQDHMHGVAAAGQPHSPVGVPGDALPAVATRTLPNAPTTASPAPIWGPAARLPTAPSPPTSAPHRQLQPDPIMHNTPPSQPTTAHHDSPTSLQPDTSSIQPEPTHRSGPAPSMMSSASGDPSTSLNGMLAATPANASAGPSAVGAPDELSLSSGDAATAPGDATTATPGISAAQLAKRRVFNPPVTFNTANDAGGVPELANASQMSEVCVDGGPPVNGVHGDMHDESLSLPLGPPRANKPLHVLPPASPQKPPLGPSGLLDGQRDASAWSPPPAVTTRSLHALPSDPDVHIGATPTSSIGDISSFSRLGGGRSLHVVPKTDRAQTEQLTPTHTPGTEIGAPGSPSGMSGISYASSRMGRRARPSLHVLRASSDAGARPTADAMTSPV